MLDPGCIDVNRELLVFLVSNPVEGFVRTESRNWSRGLVIRADVRQPRFQDFVDLRDTAFGCLFGNPFVAADTVRGHLDSLTKFGVVQGAASH